MAGMQLWVIRRVCQGILSPAPPLPPPLCNTHTLSWAGRSWFLVILNWKTDKAGDLGECQVMSDQGLRRTWIYLNGVRMTLKSLKCLRQRCRTVCVYVRACARACECVCFKRPPRMRKQFHLNMTRLPLHREGMVDGSGHRDLGHVTPRSEGQFISSLVSFSSSVKSLLSATFEKRSVYKWPTTVMTRLH